MSRYYAALLAFIFVWLVDLLMFDAFESIEGIVIATMLGLVAAGVVYAFMSRKR